jgi:hypothetical protein
LSSDGAIGMSVLKANILFLLFTHIPNLEKINELENH